MKAKFLTWVTAGCLLVAACRKEAHEAVADHTNQNAVLSEAQLFFANFRQLHVSAADKDNPRTIDWPNAVITGNGNTILVPIHFAMESTITTDSASNAFLNRNGFTWLNLTREPGSHTFNDPVVQTMLPDNTYRQKASGQFTGAILQEDWTGNQLTGLRIGQNDKDGGNGRFITVCTTIYGYNYATSDPMGGYHWSSTTCSYIALPVSPMYEFSDGFGGSSGGGSGGSSGGTSSSSPSAIIVPPPPTHRVIDIKNYTKCFQPSSTATYSVKVCVDQPVPGSRTPWGLNTPTEAFSSNPVNVGHTFLVLTQTDGNSTTTRNFGFYPSGTVYPWSPASPGAINNDEMHNYNIAGSFTISGANFMSLVNYVNSSPGMTYNLNSFNCTTWALAALSAGHIYLPSTTGSWVGGMGNDPGDLGADIQASNAPGIVKSSANDLHMNSGSCDN